MAEAGAEPCGEVAASAPDGPPNRRRHLGLLAAVAAGGLAADQLSKTWALRRLPRGAIHVAWTLDFRLTRNSGMAFSVGGGKGLGPVIALVAVVVVVALAAGSLPRTRRGAVAVGLVAAGAFGNLADRLFRSGGGFLQGAVVDFLDFGWWPVFNLADPAIVTGALLVALDSMRSQPRS